MSNRRFPTASAFLEMEERRRQYRKHIDALRSCKHMVDDSQPIPPAYLVNRRTRQTKIQKYILRTGEENIRLISRYNESRNKNKKSTSQLKPKSNRPNWVNEMYNSMAISKNSYSSSDHKIKSQKLPPLNSSFENDEIQTNEKQEIVEEPNINNTNADNEINDNNNNIEEDINDKVNDDNNDQNENENQDQNDTQDIENKNETQDQNANSNIENEKDNQNEEESKNEEENKNEDENQIETENQNENTNLNENDNKDENHEEEELNDNQNENKSENQNEEPQESQDIDQNGTQENDIEKGDENNQVDTTLGEAGEKGRLDEMLDALNGIVD